MDIVWWISALCLFVDCISTQITIEVCPQPTPAVGICSSRSIRTRCTSNMQCRPGFLCCLQGCGRMCKPALTIRQHTRSGVCPVPPPLTDVICPPGFQNACRLDTDCIADFKCCYHPCGSRCVNPSQQSRILKTGSCPNPDTLDGGPCPGSITDKCSSDNDCAAGLKCCNHPCGRMCLNLAKITPVLKSGSCPMPHHVMCYLPRRDRCSSDANCEGRSKCCSHPCGRNCVPAQSLTQIFLNGARQSFIAPSLWPSRTLPLQNINVVAEAILPIPVPYLKPGVCPAQGPVLRRCYRRRNRCASDTSCPGPLKCCERPCGKRCVLPETISEVPDRLPGCPAVDPFVKPNCNVPSPLLLPCTTDDDCLPTGQCCPHPCGSTCIPKLPVCPKYPCGKNLAIKCAYGQVRDANGCLLCKCRQSNQQCPPGTPVVNCFVNPCRFATCNNLAGVRCEANYCGGCFAIYYDINDNEVDCN